MIYEFELIGKKGTWNEDKKEMFIEEKLVDLSSLTQNAVALINKKIREKLPRPEVLKLNIGSGFRPDVNSINLDYDPDTYPDILRDLNEGLPFDSDKFDEVYSSHVIEHVKDVFLFMYEIWRVGKNKSKVTIICPNGLNLSSAIQPDHLRLINWEFFARWRPEHKSVQNELKQTRGAYFNIIDRQLINDEKEIKFILEVSK